MAQNISMTIEITENNLPQVEAELRRKTEMILEAWGVKAVDIWRKIITEKGVIDTGAFRNSTNYKVNDDTVSVGSSKQYSTFLETGTSKMAARPTLKPAIMDYKAVYEDLAKQILQQ